jgi:hypothetical protein
VSSLLGDAMPIAHNFGYLVIFAPYKLLFITCRTMTRVSIHPLTNHLFRVGLEIVNEALKRSERLFKMRGG